MWGCGASPPPTPSKSLIRIKISSCFGFIECIPIRSLNVVPVIAIWRQSQQNNVGAVTDFRGHLIDRFQTALCGPEVLGGPPHGPSGWWSRVCGEPEVPPHSIPHPPLQPAPVLLVFFLHLCTFLVEERVLHLKNGSKTKVEDQFENYWLSNSLFSSVERIWAQRGEMICLRTQKNALQSSSIKPSCSTF